MASYLITGVSRGLGFEFLRQLSSNSANIVVGLVRDKGTTEKRVLEELRDRQNVYLVQGDMTDYASLARASLWSAFDPLGVLGSEPEKLEEELLHMFKANVNGNIHLFNLTIPLVLRGRVKKMIAISTGSADIDLAVKLEFATGAPYSISKAALNMAVVKFSAQYAKEGILFMTVSPGVVDTNSAAATDEEKQKFGEIIGRFQKYAPYFKGPSTAEVAIQLMVSVIKRSSVENGDGGYSVSQFGTKQWL